MIISIEVLPSITLDFENDHFFFDNVGFFLIIALSNFSFSYKSFVIGTGNHWSNALLKWFSTDLRLYITTIPILPQICIWWSWSSSVVLIFLLNTTPSTKPSSTRNYTKCGYSNNFSAIWLSIVSPQRVKLSFLFNLFVYCNMRFMYFLLQENMMPDIKNKLSFPLN